jgi:hypothetical protein
LYTGRSDSCPNTTIGCGSATFTWAATNKVYPISMSVKDTVCNGAIAYIEFWVYYSDFSWESGPPHYASPTCGAGYSVWNNLSWGPSSLSISGVSVAVCDSVSGCVEGNYVDNPLT